VELSRVEAEVLLGGVTLLGRWAAWTVKLGTDTVVINHRNRISRATARNPTRLYGASRLIQSTLPPQEYRPPRRTYPLTVAVMGMIVQGVKTDKECTDTVRGSSARLQPIGRSVRREIGGRG
jgi:hypothetical protein